MQRRRLLAIRQVSFVNNRIKEVREAFEKEPLTTPPEQLKSRYIGRDGKVRELFGELKAAPADQKGALGQKLNAVKAELAGKIMYLTARSVAASDVNLALTLPRRSRPV